MLLNKLLLLCQIFDSLEYEFFKKKEKYSRDILGAQFVRMTMDDSKFRIKELMVETAKKAVRNELVRSGQVRSGQVKETKNNKRIR
jgi:arylamine N-acetyltransferase